MDDIRDDGLIEALGNVERHGDVAPAGDDSPAASIMRQRVDALGLIVWRDEEGRFFLTTYGRERMIARQRRLAGERGVVLQFPRRTGADRAQALTNQRLNPARPAPRSPDRQSNDAETDAEA